MGAPRKKYCALRLTVCHGFVNFPLITGEPNFFFHRFLGNIFDIYKLTNIGYPILWNILPVWE